MKPKIITALQRHDRPTFAADLLAGVTVAIPRTATNIRADGRPPLSGAVDALTILLVM